MDEKDTGLNVLEIILVSIATCVVLVYITNMFTNKNISENPKIEDSKNGNNPSAS